MGFSGCRRWAVVAAAIAGSACAHKPVLNTYRLVDKQLLPPGVVVGQPATFKVGVVVKRAACPPFQGGVALAAKRKQLQVTVDQLALAKQPEGWVSTYAAGLESNGCIPPGRAAGIAELIAYSVPLDSTVMTPPSLSARLSGQFELTPHARVQVVSPILKSGEMTLENQSVTGSGNSMNVTATMSDNVIGFERAYYVLRPRADGGYRIVPVSAERNIKGEIERREQPEKNIFQFPAEAAYYRLFYKAGESEFTALALAARTEGELEEKARLLNTGVASCERLNNELCVAIPKRHGVNAMVPVTVNGKEYVLSWGSRVGDALRVAGGKTPVSVSKFYLGKLIPVEFDKTKPEILNLVLGGGEEIRY